MLLTTPLLGQKLADIHTAFDCNPLQQQNAAEIWLIFVPKLQLNSHFVIFTGTFQGHWKFLVCQHTHDQNWVQQKKQIRLFLKFLF